MKVLFIGSFTAEVIFGINLDSRDVQKKENVHRDMDWNIGVWITASFKYKIGIFFISKWSKLD